LNPENTGLLGVLGRADLEALEQPGVSGMPWPLSS
jgi:hypothetical protein